MSTLAGGIAGLAAAAAVAILLVVGLATRPITPDVGAPPAPDVPAATFDAEIEGPGIVPIDERFGPSPMPEALKQVPWAIAVAGLVLAIVALTGGRLRRIAALTGVIVLASGASSLASHPGFGFGNGWGPLTGLDVQDEAPRGSGGPDVWYVTADPGDPFGIVFDVRNPGPLPIRLLGVPEDVGIDQSVKLWAALWIHDGPEGEFPAAERAEPFRPIEVPPRESVVLYLVGRAGPCAFGSGFTLEDAQNLTYSSFDGVSIAYSVLGLSAVGAVELPVVVALPQREDCGS